MKSFLTIIIAVSLFGLIGCGSSTESTPAPEATTAATQKADQKDASTMEATPLINGAEADSHVGSKTTGK